MLSRPRTRLRLCLPLPLRLAVLFFSLSALQTFSLFAETLTIATYNLSNYLPTDRVVRGVFQKNYPKPEPEKTALRTVIKALNADILAIQEIGPRALLDELIRDLKRDGIDYPYADMLESPADPERHTAVLSRRPFTKVNKHTDLAFKYLDATETVKRGLLEVHVATDAGDLALFIVHLKSRLTDRPEDPESAIRRAAEATAIRNQILKIYPTPTARDARFLILGDFNDTTANRPLRALEQRGKIQIATPLPGADSRGEVWTDFYAKQDTYSRIDHILVSPALKRAVQNNAVTIYDDSPNVLTASDHRPVLVRLTLGK